MKIALIHDHLAQDGGAENVVRAFCEIWPEAPIYVLVHDRDNAHPFFNTKDVRTSFIQRMPLGLRKYQWFFPLMPTAVETYDLSEYDVVLSSAASYAKGVITKPDTLHISYCHSPTRYLWSDTHQYVQELGVGNVLKKILPVFLSYVRIWDRHAADRVDSYIANSQLVESRIQKYYKRDSTVIHPPVKVDDFVVAPKEEVEDFFLAGGRLVYYKRFDLLIEAFNKLGKPLKIFGDGPARAELEKIAGENIEFLGRVPDDQLKKLYSTCAAFLNPQEEDFGITMIEALAAGRPVIAYNKGGAREIVDHGSTGLLIDHQSWESFADVLMDFDKHTFDPKVIRAKALTFEHEQFKKKIEEYVRSSYETFRAEQ